MLRTTTSTSSFWSSGQPVGGRDHAELVAVGAAEDRGGELPHEVDVEALDLAGERVARPEQVGVGGDAGDESPALADLRHRRAGRQVARPGQGARRVRRSGARCRRRRSAPARARRTRVRSWRRPSAPGSRRTRSRRAPRRPRRRGRAGASCVLLAALADAPGGGPGGGEADQQRHHGQDQDPAVARAELVGGGAAGAGDRLAGLLVERLEGGRRALGRRWWWRARPRRPTGRSSSRVTISPVDRRVAVPARRLPTSCSGPCGRPRPRRPRRPARSRA